MTVIEEGIVLSVHNTFPGKSHLSGPFPSLVDSSEV